MEIEEFVKGCVKMRGDARAVDLAHVEYLNKRILADMAKLLRATGHLPSASVAKHAKQKGSKSIPISLPIETSGATAYDADKPLNAYASMMSSMSDGVTSTPSGNTASFTGGWHRHRIANEIARIRSHPFGA